MSGQHYRLSTLSRRQFIIGTSSIALSAQFPFTVQSATEVNSVKTLAFLNLHTNEKLQCCYWQDDHYDHNSLKKINTLLRDHRSGEIYPIDKALLNMLLDVRYIPISH